MADVDHRAAGDGDGNAVDVETGFVAQQMDLVKARTNPDPAVRVTRASMAAPLAEAAAATAQVLLAVGPSGALRRRQVAEKPGSASAFGVQAARAATRLNQIARFMGPPQGRASDRRSSRRGRR